ncbi:MAG: hypothetical protein M2R45_03334 [Verrucomicrobia subdivision 3 bacterium]|nr:hypothetical protein [Limisphaerales bacterium]MCS1415385.1 hypothetical protein [Limisphaerales bacterium]
MEVDFPSLAKVLKLTDGTLGAHPAKLEQAGYIDIKKTFVNRKPKTYVQATMRGHTAFDDHVVALRQILDGERFSGPSTARNGIMTNGSLSEHRTISRLNSSPVETIGGFTKC